MQPFHEIACLTITHELSENLIVGWFLRRLECIDLNLHWRLANLFVCQALTHGIPIVLSTMGFIKNEAITRRRLQDRTTVHTHQACDTESSIWRTHYEQVATFEAQFHWLVSEPAKWRSISNIRCNTKTDSSLGPNATHVPRWQMNNWKMLRCKLSSQFTCSLITRHRNNECKSAEPNRQNANWVWCETEPGYFKFAATWE